MKKINEEEIKKISLEIMKDIHRVCKENNIKYTLIGGSLIGAIRHKGIIPWDDDIDLAMKREEYEKFIRIYSKNHNNQYEILTNVKNKDYYYLFAKVIDKRTLVDEQTVLDIKDLGVFVDIFPIDNISSKKMKHTLRKIKWYTKALAYRITKKRRNNIKEYIKKIVFRKDFQKYLNKIQEISLKENNKICENAGVLVCGTGKKDIFPSEIFNEYIEVPFEDANFMIIKEYEIFLKHRFGDYMKLPPIEEQQSHHDMVAYWKGEDK